MLDRVNVPAVSIILPAFNAEAHIADAIESIRRQTFSDFEVLVVDDGSVDLTQSKALKAIGGDPRFLLVRQPNGGVSAARNTGLRLARGEWISFVDADDILAPKLLERLWNKTAESIDLVIGGIRLSGCTREVQYCAPNCVLDQDGVRLLAASILSEKTCPQLVGCSKIVGYVYSKLYRRTLLSGVWFVPRISMREDALFNLRVVCSSRRIALTSSADYTYRVAEGTLSSSFHPNYDEEVNAFLAECESICRSNGLLESSYPDAVVTTYMTWLKLFVLHHEAPFDRRERLKMIRHSFGDQRWKGGFNEVRSRDLGLHYVLLKYAYLSHASLSIVALKFANDLRKRLKW